MITRPAARDNAGRKDWRTNDAPARSWSARRTFPSYFAHFLFSTRHELRQLGVIFSESDKGWVRSFPSWHLAARVG